MAGSILDMINLQDWAKNLVNIPWESLADQIQGIFKSIPCKQRSEGIYEVEDLETTLELWDAKGTRATIHKRKRVRFLQDNIIAFQDYAWGDGEILLNYRSSKGIPVDCYRSGYKTYILLSLREVKNRGDIEEFNIQWNIRKGFLTKDGYWSTDISQRTEHARMKIIFPKSRPPQRVSLEENIRRRTLSLGREAQAELPDGRRQITWEADHPRMGEIYVLRWIW